MYGLFTYMNGEKWLHSRGNVGKSSIHGASGSIEYQTQKEYQSVQLPGLGFQQKEFSHLGVSQNNGKTPKMDGENNGSKPY